MRNCSVPVLEIQLTGCTFFIERSKIGLSQSLPFFVLNINSTKYNWDKTALPILEPTDLSLSARDAKSIEAKWTNPKQNFGDLSVLLLYKDTETAGSLDKTVSGSVAIGKVKKLLSGLEPNTIYSVQTCICKTANSGKCACAALRHTAATQPLGKCHYSGCFRDKALWPNHDVVYLLQCLRSRQ